MTVVAGAINRIRDQWVPGRDRVLWSPVFFGIGIALYFSLIHEPSVWYVASSLALSFLLCLLVQRRFPEWVFVAFALFLMVLGFNAAVWRTHSVQSPQIVKEIGPVGVTGVVQDVTVADENDGKTKRQVLLRGLSIDRLVPEDTPATIRLTSYHIPAEVKPGDRIYILAKLMPPSGPVVPGGFDYRRQAFFDQIGAVGFTLGKFALLEQGQPHHVTQWFNSVRRDIASRITAVLPSPESAVATALLAGERASIPKDVNQDLIDSGLFHLLSISGLHIAIVCGSVFFAVRFLLALMPYVALRWPIKKIAAVLALLAGLFYMMLAGAPVPTQRSMMMTGLALVAVMADRSALSMRTIAIAALLVMVIHPESLIGASFQLSFAAVLAMIAFYEDFGRRWLVADKTRGMMFKAAMYLGGIIITTILVGVATLPSVLHHFGRIQLFGILGNAAAIPITSFIIMPFGTLALMVMPLGLEKPFLIAVNFGVDAMLDVAHWVAHLPHAVLAVPGLPMPYYLTAAFGFLLLCLWRGSLRFAGVPIMVGAILLGLYAPRAVALMDGEGRSFGVKSHADIAYALKTPSEFTRRNWLGFWGGQEYNDGKAVRENAWQSGDISMVCDDWACRAMADGKAISILKNAAVLPQECAEASLVVLVDKASHDLPCAAVTITSWDVRDAGGYAFYVERDGWRAKPFMAPGSDRPWLQQVD